MAIINNNVQNVKFLRNQDVNITRDAAISLLNTHKEDAADGTALLARYTVSGTVKTIVGFVYVTGSTHDITIFDTEGASGDVETLREEINAKLGEGITSENTATGQLAALSGNGQSTSADTSVEGAKRYADELKNQMDYTGVTTGDGVYVTNVTQSDGIVSATTATLPTVEAITEAGKPIIAVAEDKGTIAASAGTINAEYVNVTGSVFSSTTVQGALEEIDGEYKAAIDALDYTDTAVTGSYVSKVDEVNGVIAVTREALPTVSDSASAKTFVTSVSEDKGQIAVTKGTITSANKTITLTDNADGGVDFAANVDGTTIIINQETGVMSVASSALVQYEGDTKTIAISPVQDGVRTVSTLLTLSSVTPSSTTVKEEYALKNASGETIGSTIKIYKDSSVVSISYITDPSDAHYQNLEYTYIDVSGNTQVAYVDMSSLVLEAEFASGVTFSDGVAHGVVDSQSETFLTVGANGFKLAGVQDAINAAVSTAVEALDADVSGNTTHVTVNVVEADGVITGVNVAENNIANANDLATLSGKTVTAITSTNGSITASIDDAVGNKTYDIQTDADKILMSGFTSNDALSGITEADSISDAFGKVDAVITHNEEVTAAALTDLDDRIETVSGDVDTIKNEYISGVSVNGNTVTVANKVAPISITAATSAATGTTAIVVDTDNSGNITLGISSIDCGYYSE